MNCKEEKDASFSFENYFRNPLAASANTYRPDLPHDGIGNFSDELNPFLHKSNW